MSLAELRGGQPGPIPLDYFIGSNATKNTPDLGVPHLVIRATYLPNTIRCTAPELVRSPSYYRQRAPYLRDLGPGGSYDMVCLADVRVGEYILGAGPATLPVIIGMLYYHWLPGEHTPEEMDADLRKTEDVYANGGSTHELYVPTGIPGEERILFLNPSWNTVIEAWHSGMPSWDVQRGAGGTALAVHPHRDYWRDRSGQWETYKATVEMTLPDFKRAVLAAHQARLANYGGRIYIHPDYPDHEYPMLRTNANDLPKYMREVGAYTMEGGPPKPPPPACGLVVSDQADNSGLMNDCRILLEAKDQLRGTGTLNWDTSTAIASWDGVTVAGTPKRVTKLKLTNKSLTGTIPFSLAGLTALTELKLAGNTLAGCVHPDLKAVASHDLASLGLPDCHPCDVGFVVRRPADHPGLTSDCKTLLGLKSALAGTAALDWSADSAISGWEGITLGGSPQRVTEIVLDRKKLTGAIPPELAALSRLENLRLSHNQLTRGIPPELGTLEALMQLWLNDNSLSGTIPAELGEPEDLEVVYLGGNSLQGCMPGTLGDARVNDFHRLNLPACAMERPAAPSGLAASLSGGTFTLTWTGVAGAGAYEAQHRAPGQSSWTALPTVMSTSATYTPEEAPPCDTTYGFRVRARGDGLTHPTYWGQPSDVQTYTTGSCNLPPEFDPETYTFSIADSAATGSAVGTVLATDPDTGDTLTYSITGGNEDDKFAIGESTGAVTVKAALAYAAAASYTLTVQADDGKGGTDTATVGVSLTLAACSNGTVVPRPAQNPRLVRDCSILLTAKDTLAGDGALNWSANLAMNRWTGAAVEREQDLYLRFLMLTDAGLTGTIPASFAGLKDLTRLDLDQNDLTGGIPAELGDMTNLDQLYLQDNRLSGNIPDELANLTHLRYLHLYDNRLTGSMPARLGELNALKELLLDDNRLTGAIPAEVGDMEGLRILFLRNNQFSGAIPAALEHLSNLTQLYLEGNGFTGCIPAGLQDVENNDLDLLGLTDCTT